MSVEEATFTVTLSVADTHTLRAVHISVDPMVEIRGMEVRVQY